MWLVIDVDLGYLHAFMMYVTILVVGLAAKTVHYLSTIKHSTSKSKLNMSLFYLVLHQSTSYLNFRSVYILHFNKWTRIIRFCMHMCLYSDLHLRLCIHRNYILKLNSVYLSDNGNFKHKENHKRGHMSKTNS